MGRLLINDQAAPAREEVIDILASIFTGCLHDMLGLKHLLDQGPWQK